MTAPTVTALPALPTFPSGPGLPDQPGVFIPQFLLFLTALQDWPDELAALVTYLEGLSGGGGGSGDMLAANNLSDLVDTATARTNLGVAIGSNVQAYSAALALYAAISPSANVQTLLGSADYAAFKTSLSAASSGAATASGLTMSTAKMLGRTTASTGAIEEISVGSGLSLSGGSLTAGPTTGSAAWALAGSWTYAADIANVDITGLASYNELVIIGRGLTASVSGVRRIQVSTDNGSSFYSGATDYLGVNASGAESNAATPSIGFHDTNSGAARSVWVHLRNTKGATKWASGLAASPGGHIVFVGSSSDINAIRLNSHNGGNIQAGTLLVYGR